MSTLFEEEPTDFQDAALPQKTATQHKPFRHLIIEFSLIVAGVLAALWINAAWAYYQDRQKERQILEDLRQDFQANLVLIDQVIHARNALIRHNLGVIDQGAAHIAPDSLVHYFESTYALVTYNPQQGALSTALSSGSFNLIRDNVLRSRLAAWGGYLDDAQEEINALIPLNYAFLQSLSDDIRLAFLPVLQGMPPDATTMRNLLEKTYSIPEKRQWITIKTLIIYQMHPELLKLRQETVEILDMLGE